jgi:hypothetical protein
MKRRPCQMVANFMRNCEGNALEADVTVTSQPAIEPN